MDAMRHEGKENYIMTFKLVLFISHYYGVHTMVDTVDATCTTHRMIRNEKIWQFHCMLR
jgi:hypothetical protein